MVYMNGAAAEPWVKTIRPPNTKETTIIGSNQYFFLVRMKAQSSIKNDIILALKLIFHCF